MHLLVICILCIFYYTYRKGLQSLSFGSVLFHLCRVLRGWIFLPNQSSRNLGMGFTCSGRQSPGWVSGHTEFIDSDHHKTRKVRMLKGKLSVFVHLRETITEVSLKLISISQRPNKPFLRSLRHGNCRLGAMWEIHAPVCLLFPHLPERTQPWFSVLLASVGSSSRISA